MGNANQRVTLLLVGVLLLGGCTQASTGGTSSVAEPPPTVSSSVQAPSAQESSSKQDTSSAQDASSTQDADKPPTVLGELAKLGAAEGNWLNMTKEQMQEDANYLHQTLLENFPYFNVIQRKLGVDMEAEFLTCLQEIEACETDGQFYIAIDKWIRKADGLGHLTLFQPGMYEIMAQEAKEDALREGNDDALDWQRMAVVYNDEKSKRCFEGMGKVLEPLFERVNAYYAALESEDETAAQSETDWKNIETKILEPGKIAYIAINSFDKSQQEEDQKLLFDFYNQVKDYEHVIFDFTQNSGGSMDYFDELVAAPNIDKPLTTNVYMFLMGGEYNLSFFDTGSWKQVSVLPTLPRMDKEDLAKLDFYDDMPFMIQPLGEKALNGKLWMLVGPNVFSSSEYAAMLTKSTGFMTLVGTTTGGDGIGYEPLPLVLPNSGLMVRYSAVYGTTADGAGSQEWGTEPDIVSPAGEEALDTCLKAIRQAR